MILPNRISGHFERIPRTFGGVSLRCQSGRSCSPRYAGFVKIEKIRMMNIKLNCLPVQLEFVDLMTASNNSLHKIIIYMSPSYTHPIFNQVHLATASVWKPTETGGFCISKL